MALEALIPVIATSWRASTTAANNGHFHQEVEVDTAFFAFKRSFLEGDWFAPENESSFGETKMNRHKFPCMRSFSHDVDADSVATVNEAFLKNLQRESGCRRIVFTGHSSGGATAILATVWYLETYFTITKQSESGGFPFPEALCVTFGAPLVGDYVFEHALGRENWSRFFLNFVTRSDIVPRIMLAPKASTKQALPYALSQLGRRDSTHENDQTIAGFYSAVMKDTEIAARQADCELIGDGENAFLETFSSFLELSPYRPAGTFVFSTGTRMVSVSNSDAILQILFYASQSSNEGGRPHQSISDHHRYEEMVDSMRMQVVYKLNLDHLPLGGGESALSDLRLSTSARECVQAAFLAEKKQVVNQKKIDTTFFSETVIDTTKEPKTIVDKLKWIKDEYKQPRCLTPAKGYYDSFKESNN